MNQTCRDKDIVTLGSRFKTGKYFREKGCTFSATVCLHYQETEPELAYPPPPHDFLGEKIVHLACCAKLL